MNVKVVVFAFTGAIGIIILVLAFVYWCDSFTLSVDRAAVVKDAFDLIVSHVLLSMFTTLVTAVLTYVFGKQLVSAFSGWLLKKGSTNA